jgi:hypothetical protein
MVRDRVRICTFAAHPMALSKSQWGLSLAGICYMVPKSPSLSIFLPVLLIACLSAQLKLPEPAQSPFVCVPTQPAFPPLLNKPTNSYWGQQQRGELRTALGTKLPQPWLALLLTVPVLLSHMLTSCTSAFLTSKIKNSQTYLKGSCEHSAHRSRQPCTPGTVLGSGGHLVSNQNEVPEPRGAYSLSSLCPTFTKLRCPTAFCQMQTSSDP